MRVVVGRHRGFTLVELLVVLAILVILLGLLFAPMLTGIEIARKGQRRARLQDTARLAMEVIKRDISNAMYVCPPRRIAAANGTIATNFSELVLLLPGRDRRPGTPLAPEHLLMPLSPNTTQTSPNFAEGIRYVIHPASGPIYTYDYDPVRFPAGSTPESGPAIYEPTLDEPMVLFRQVGGVKIRPDGSYAFGDPQDLVPDPSDPAPGAVMPRPETCSSENALSLKDGFDVPVTGSICLSCGEQLSGFRRYPDACPRCGGTLGYSYVFESVRFTPEQIVAETLVGSNNGSIYGGGHKAWTGRGWADNSVPPLLAPAGDPAMLDPRITIHRYVRDAVQGDVGYAELQYDSYDAAVRGSPRPLVVRWSVDDGGVKLGRMYVQKFRVARGPGWDLANSALDELDSGLVAMAPLSTAPSKRWCWMCRAAPPARCRDTRTGGGGSTRAGSSAWPRSRARCWTAWPGWWRPGAYWRI